VPLNTPNAQDSPTYAGQAVVDKTDLAAIANVAQGYGVVSGCLVSAGGGYNVNVAVGVILVAGVQVPVTAVTALAPSAASSTDRRDIVVASTTGVVSIVSGTPTTETAIPWPITSVYNPPVKPAIPAGSVLLAEIYIPGGGGTILAGWITDKTLTNPYLTGVGAQTAIRSAANQDQPRRGGNIGVATSVDASSAFPYGQIEAVIGDSIAAGTGASSFGKTDWGSILANQENRLLGLPDAGIGFTDAAGTNAVYNTPSFSTVGASCTAVAGLGPEVNNAVTAVQLGAASTTSTLAGATNSLTDNRVFNRALIFYKAGAAYDNIGVSVQGQNGATFATINTTAATTPGNLTVSIYDTGVIASPTVAPTLSMFRVTRGGTAPIIYGALYFAPGVAGTSGLSMLNMGAGGTGTADWTTNRLWESALSALSGSIRRVHVRLGGNDFVQARGVGDAVFNNSTTLTSATAVFTPGDIGRVISGNVNIPAGTTVSAWVSATQVTLSAATTGGSLTAQIVVFGQISVAVTQANLTTVISRIRAACPLAEITVFGEYLPGAVGLNTASFVTPSAYVSNQLQATQSVAYNNNCSYVDMFTRFGATQYRPFTDCTIANASTTVTSTSMAQFCALDVGSKITGTNIPASTTITAVASPTSATMSAAATGVAPAAATITAASVAASVLTCTAAQTYTAGQNVTFSGLTGSLGVLNGGTYPILASGLTTSSFGVACIVPGTFSGSATATPAYVINADVYGLTMDSGLHFGDSTNSANKVDGQRAHADEVWERLGYAKAIPAATPGLVTLTSGTNWLCPTSGTYLVNVIGGGGGGGGGGSTTTVSGTATGGGGGGSGATATGILSLTAGTLYPYSIAAASAGGAGGAAAGTNAGSSGTNGNATTFATGPLVRAAGGGAGAGGAVSNATQNINGGCYGYAAGTTALGAGIGGPANVAGIVALGGGGPVSASAGAGGGGGNGGATNLGGTGGGAGTATAGGTAGTNAAAGTGAGTAGAAASSTAYGAGGGGGGGGNNSLAGGAGGAGAPGVIYIQKVG